MEDRLATPLEVLDMRLDMRGKVIAEQDAELDRLREENAAMTTALEAIRDSSPVYNDTSQLRGWIEQARAIAADGLANAQEAKAS